VLPADLSVMGIVFAVILFIVFFSAVILYLAFRIKETFREEKKRGILAVKVVFLIGILFLAGGSFYFFAQVLAPSSTANTTSPTNLPPTSSTNETVNGKLELALSISYPSSVKMGTAFTITFTITNPTEQTAHDVVIQTNQLLQTFELSTSTHQVIGNVIEIGDVTETAICSIELIAPSKPARVEDTVSLTYKEMVEPISHTISVSVTGGKK